jgi:hypothetical protein
VFLSVRMKVRTELKDRSIQVIFWSMVAFFVITVGTMFIGVPLAGNLPLGYFILPSLVIFLALSVTLLVLTVKKKIEGKLRIFLLLTGASAVGLPVFVVLHNLVYALFIHFFGENFWGAGGDEPVFFILATIVCPLGFLVGVVGTIVLAIKNKSNVPAVKTQGGEGN